MFHRNQKGFSLIETLVGVVIAGVILFGARSLLLRSQEGNARDSLRKNAAETSQELTRRMNHFYKRQSGKIVNSPDKLTLTLPSGPVIVQTVCAKSTLSFQDPDVLLARCMKCGKGERQVVRIQSAGKTQTFPGGAQRVDLPAGASICFKNGADPEDVEIIVEILLVDPVNHSDKKVNKFESLLVKDVSKINAFE